MCDPSPILALGMILNKGEVISLLIRSRTVRIGLVKQLYV